MGNSNQLGEAYFDHYEKYLGKPIDNLIFEDQKLEWKIQILVYPNVFEKCVTFATVGLSHFADELGCVGEIVCVVDACEVAVPRILFNTVKSIVLNKMELGWGMGITGNDKVSEEFFKATGKNSIYITDPLPFPEGLELLTDFNKDHSPRVFLGIFISDLEYRLFCDKGAKEFENYLERENIDPFDVMRAERLSQK